MDQSNKRPATCRDLGDGDIGLWVSFDDKDRAKSVPGARWDPGLKCWRVRTLFRAEAETLVTALNGGADMELIDAFLIVFRRIPKTLREPTFKALVRVLHPDAGGDTKVMQAINVAWAEGRR